MSANRGARRLRRCVLGGGGDRAGGVGLRRRDPALRPPLGLRLHEPRDARDAGRRHRQSRPALGARGRNAVEPEDRRRRPRLRRLPRRCPREHEGRGRAPSGVRRRAGTAGQSRAAHQSLPYRPTAGAAARLREPRPSRADRLRRAPIARPADRRSRSTSARSRSSMPAAPPSIGARASSISPAANVTTTTGDGSSRATSSRRRTRPGTRSTGWSGRASARSSAGCATVWSGSAPNRTSSAPPNSSTWSCS